MKKKLRRIKWENIMYLLLNILILVVYIITDRHIGNTFKGITAWGLSMIALLITIIMVYRARDLYNVIRRVKHNEKNAKVDYKQKNI